MDQRTSDCQTPIFLMPRGPPVGCLSRVGCRLVQTANVRLQTNKLVSLQLMEGR